jgi:SNF2 family DNA or RNA helicase
VRKLENRFFERVQARVLIERLLLKRSPLDYQAYVETFRESLIDANPHQIEAIVFALEKLENGGCVLADEVGLGKTIEAGLVISQYRAQRRFNILIIVPTSLAGQWSSELRRLFQIPSRIVTSRDKKGLKKEDFGIIFEKDGVYILGREFASRLEKEKVLSKKQWDLIVVDEAHEIFANIYRRFNPRTGGYKFRSKQSTRAAHMYYLFKRSKVILLTATPIQNNILELWGLSAYILPDTIKSQLGQFNHFKGLFLRNGEVIVEKIPELKKRISNFLVRNLRVNAQDFMKYKFTNRNCETLNFYMDDEEKILYNNISNYFERDDVYAYSTHGVIDLKDDRKAGIRNLLKMSYRKALGSSFSALTRSLHGIVSRLEKMKAGEWETTILASATDDWENDEEIYEQFGVDVEQEETRIPFTPSASDIIGIDQEIKEVKAFISQAEKLGATGKDKLLVNWLNKIFETPDKFNKKAVIFTTYTATQQHLLDILEKSGFKDEVLLFSGSRASSTKEKEDLKKALKCWEEEVGPTVSPAERPTGNILERTALVHYFKTRKKIFISTEAGAKGLNLQFCNIIINYDLPWNPQRIEQRIGRCHRYGQVRDVLVINCINADNETEQHIYNILENKFSLFKSLMGAGDDILGTLSKAINFETRVQRLWLNHLEEEIDESTRKLRDDKLKKTRTLLDELDPQVKSKLKNIKEKLPESFSRYDTDMLNLLRCIAISRDIPFKEVKKEDEQVFLEFDKNPYYIGKRDEENIRDFQHIDLKHPILEDWIKRIREETIPDYINVCVDFSDSSEASKILKPYVGYRGRWDFYRVEYKGFEEEQRLYDIVCIDCDEELKLLQQDEVEALKNIRFSIIPGGKTEAIATDEEMQKHLSKKIKEDTLHIQQHQQPRIDKKIHNLEVELKDMEEYKKKEEQDILADLEEIDKKINSTFDVDAGKKLLEQKRKRQKDLNRCRKDLLEFQTNFRDTFDEEELNLMAKRFIKESHEKIFSLEFHVR